MRGVFRSRVEHAAKDGVALIAKYIVCNALLHVGSLAGKNQQRLVLRLPAEARDGPVIAAGIETPKDAQPRLDGGVRGKIGLQCAVRSVLHKAEPKGRRGDPEYNVVVGKLPRKIFLRQTAAGCVKAAANRIQVVYAAVQATGGIHDESCFSYRAFGENERWNRVGGPVQRGQRDLRVRYWMRGTVESRAASANCRLSMALCATVAVKSRTQAHARLARNCSAY